jgi:hypothetical protein
MLPRIGPLQYPGQALACVLYADGGVQTCEIGTVMFGVHPAAPRLPRRWIRSASPSAPHLHPEPHLVDAGGGRLVVAALAEAVSAYDLAKRRRLPGQSSVVWRPR